MFINGQNMIKNIKKSQISVCLFFLLFLVVGLCVFKDYGIPLDGTTQRNLNGIINVKYILGIDDALLTSIERYHGAAFEVFLVGMEKLLRLTDSRHIYLLRHLMIFLLYYTGVFFFFLICKKRFQSWGIALFGTLLFILSPRIFANAFYNSKDIPFLAIFIISVYTLLQYLDRKTFQRAVIHAFMCGLLIDTRILGMFITAMTFFFVGIDLFLAYRSKKFNTAKTAATLLVFTVFLIVFIIMFWPILWDGPAYHFIQSFIQMIKYTPWIGSVFYFGSKIKGTNLPWHYAPVWMILTTPIMYTAAFFGGTVLCVKSILKSMVSALKNTRARYDLIFFLWFYTPLLSVIFLRSVLYDGWRHLFFIYPALIIISLHAYRYLFVFIEKFKAKNIRFYRLGICCMGVFILLSLIHTSAFMVKYHPHQNVYFNEIALLNMEKIRDNFELDYWGLSCRKGLEFLLDYDKSPEITVMCTDKHGRNNRLIMDEKQRRRLNIVRQRASIVIIHTKSLEELIKKNPDILVYRYNEKSLIAYSVVDEELGKKLKKCYTKEKDLFLIDRLINESIKINKATYFITTYRWYKREYDYELIHSIKIGNATILDIFKMK